MAKLNILVCHDHASGRSGIEYTTGTLNRGLGCISISAVSVEHRVLIT